MKIPVHCQKESYFAKKNICKYIVAVDKENIVLFICSYREDIWEILIERCKDSLEYILNEEEYTVFKTERKKLMDQVEKETVERELERYYKKNKENQ